MMTISSLTSHALSVHTPAGNRCGYIGCCYKAALVIQSGFCFWKYGCYNSLSAQSSLSNKEPPMSAKIHCAILDDYQHVALSFADWSLLKERVEMQVLSEHIADETELAAAIIDAEIVIIMRERTPFSASLLARLPNLKLLITSG